LKPRAIAATALAALLASGCGGGEDEGTARMVARLAALVETSDPMTNVYRNAERAAILAERQPEPGNEAQHAFRLAYELLMDGQTGEAIGWLQALEGRMLPEFLRPVLGAAYLRLGEQENCIANHGEHSCILPIEGGGRHTLPRGSTGSIEHFEAHLAEHPDDLGSRWLLNVAYMTLGRWPDEVPERWRVPADAFDSEYDIGRFADRAPALGLDLVGLAGGSVVEDFDGDGDYDLLVSSGGMRDPLTYFENNGASGFANRSAEAGLTGLVGGLNLVHADYDGDGDFDALVLRGAWLGVPPCTDGGAHPNSLLGNRGTARFDDVTEAAGLLSFHPTQTASFADTDLDGDLDLFIGNETTPRSAEHPCEFYENDGDGTFTERGAELGVAVTGLVKGCGFGDYDNDGRPDLYVSRLWQENLLFHNEGERFTDRAAAAGVAEPVASFPTWFFDYDNDGWLDLFVSGYGTQGEEAWAAVCADYLGRESDGERPRLYRNRGDGTFEDVTRAQGLHRVLFTMGCNFGDLDNDGWLDMYLGTGDPMLQSLMPNRMFRNDAGRRFQDVTTSGGFGHLQKGHGVSFADLDGDGDQDVHTTLGGFNSGDTYQNALFENPGHGGHWLGVELEGVRSNRHGVGARVQLTLESAAGAREIHRRVTSGGSFGGSPFRLEIGLGQARRVARLEVRWPGGAEPQVFEGIEADQVVRLREGATDYERVRLTPTPFASVATPHTGHH